MILLQATQSAIAEKVFAITRDLCALFQFPLNSRSGSCVSSMTIDNPLRLLAGVVKRAPFTERFWPFPGQQSANSCRPPTHIGIHASLAERACSRRCAHVTRVALDVCKGQRANYDSVTTSRIERARDAEKHTSANARAPMAPTRTPPPRSPRVLLRNPSYGVGASASPNECSRPTSSNSTRPSRMRTTRGMRSANAGL